MLDVVQRAGAQSIIQAQKRSQLLKSQASHLPSRFGGLTEGAYEAPLVGPSRSTVVFGGKLLRRDVGRRRKLQRKRAALRVPWQRQQARFVREQNDRASLSMVGRAAV